jgi:hypothetical protein
MNNEVEKLQKRKLQYELWRIDNEADIQNINTINQAIVSNYINLDKNLLYLSSGAIALSVPLLVQLSQITISNFGKISLLVAWFFFGFTIILTLIGYKLSNLELVDLKRKTLLHVLDSKKFHISSMVLDDEVLNKATDSLIVTNENMLKKSNKKTTSCLEYINEFALYSFVAGIISLGTFLINMLLNN